METRVPISGAIDSKGTLSEALLIDDAKWTTGGRVGVSFRYEGDNASFIVDAEALRHALRAYDAKNP